MHHDITRRRDRFLLLSGLAIVGAGLLACPETVIEGVACGGGTILNVDTNTCEPVDAPTSCGGGTSLDEASGLCVPTITCGDGTSYVAATGTCEPDTRCGADTVFDEASGLCEPSVVCGASTIFDPATGTCSPTALCGPHTALDDSGVCLPVNRCGTGTTFEPLTGLCLPDTVCGGGFVRVDDLCLTPNEALSRDADVTAVEPDDPRLGGTPVAVTLPAQRASLVLAGEIGRPVDVNNDGVVDQDTDVFTFEGVVGQVLRIRVLDNGLPQPSFLLTGPRGYQRSSALGASFEADRVVVLPRTGSYTLTILPTAARRAPRDGIGGSGQGWVGIIDHLAPPTPRVVTPQAVPARAEVEGTVQNTLANVFDVPVALNGQLVVSLRSKGVSTWPTLLVFDRGTGAFLAEFVPDTIKNAPGGTMCDAAQKIVDCNGVRTTACSTGSDGLRVLGFCEAAANPLFDDTFVALRGLVSPSDAGVRVVVDWTASGGYDQAYTVGFATEAPATPLVLDGNETTPVDILVQATGLAGASVQLPADSLVQVRFDQVRTTVTVPVFISVFGPDDVVELGAQLAEGHYRFYTGAGGRYSFVVANQGAADVTVNLALRATPATVMAAPDATTTSRALAGRRLGFDARFADIFPVAVKPAGALAVSATLDAIAFPRSDTARLEVGFVDVTGRIVNTRIVDGQNALARATRAAAGDTVLFLVNPRFQANIAQASHPELRDWSMDVVARPSSALSQVFADDLSARAAPQAIALGEVVATPLLASQHHYFEIPVDTLGPDQMLEVLADWSGGGQFDLRVWNSLQATDPIAHSRSGVGPAVFLLAEHGPGPFFAHVTAPALAGELVLRARVRDLRVVNEPSSTAVPTDLGTVTLPFEARGRVVAPDDEDTFIFQLASPLLAGEGLVLNAMSADDNAAIRVDVFDHTAGGAALDFAVQQRVATIVRPVPGNQVRVRVTHAGSTTGGIVNTDRTWAVRIDRVSDVELEPNNTAAAPEDLGPIGATPVRRQGAVLRGNLDVFRFAPDGVLGDTEALVVTWETRTARDDTRVNIVDANNTLIAFSDRTAGRLVVPAGAPGPFAVALDNEIAVGATSRAPELYTLTVSREALTPEAEPQNNDRATVVPVASSTLPRTFAGQGRQATTSPVALGDVDVIGIELDDAIVAGTTLRASLDGLTTRPFFLRLLDETGAVLAEDNHFEPVLAQPLPALPAGTRLFIEVASQETKTNTTAPYLLDVELE